MIAPDARPCDKYLFAGNKKGAHPAVQEEFKQGERIGGMLNAYQVIFNEAFRDVI
ncbi:hypothetical protein J8M97_10545 [Gordonia polyisoprenivorans]|uniref:hypothetical protein n=1 Tax=Gordonia polyisoprenivorans TaxID=84595 RepID=UPI001B8B4F45|nr:hypothetical protein [Gordonia polyisoprenivorans]QUD84962.1 hypothetical protein J8M97_10545 [Gordonia polyisoprenivorans]WCB39489.1 hypothetical protein PHA63_10465 [Gordonia polyisoprenivorans]